MRGKILIAAFAAALLCGCAAHDIKPGKDTSAMDKRGESAAAWSPRGRAFQRSRMAACRFLTSRTRG